MSNFSISQATYKIDRTLSRAQALPIIGFALVSPVKYMFGVAEVVGGIAIAAFFAWICLVYSGKNMKNYAIEGLLIAKNGFTSVTYSIINLFSLGIIGFVAEVSVAFCGE